MKKKILLKKINKIEKEIIDLRKIIEEKEETINWNDEEPFYYGKKSIINFGKHKGKTVEYLMEIQDYSYLIWANENVKEFNLLPSLLIEIIENINPYGNNETMYEYINEY